MIEKQPSVISSRVAETMHMYRLYGLSIWSDFQMPVSEDETVGHLTPDVVIERASVQSEPPLPDGPMVSEETCDGPCHNGAAYFRAHRGPGGAWLWNAGVGTCHIAPGEQKVTVYPGREVDDRVIGLFLLGQVLTYILYRRGFLTLHASAVVMEQGAAVFLGPKGQGKSTMAAAFVHREGQLLTDDLLPLTLVDGVVYGIPGPAIMKVWPATALHTLGISDALPDLHPQVEKKLLMLDGALRVADEPGRLHAIYVLQRFEPTQEQRPECTFRSLTGAEAITALLTKMSAASYYFTPGETARFLPLISRLAKQAPVRELRFPDGFQYQAMIHERILADMERS